MKNILIIFIPLLIYSCSGYQYVPCPHYVPLNTEKGELSADVGHNNVQLGYTFSNHFSFFTAGKFRNTRDSFDIVNFLGRSEGSTAGYGTNHYGDNAYEANIGTSYFNKYKFLRFEVLCGTGLGKLNYDHSIEYSNDYKFNLQANRFDVYIQPDVGININGYIEAGISAKFSGYFCYHIKTKLVPGDNQKNISSDNYFIGKKRADMYFFEPGITFRGGLKNFKAQTQIVPVLNLTSNRIRYRALSWFLSFSMNLNVLKIIANSKPQETAIRQF